MDNKIRASTHVFKKNEKKLKVILIICLCAFFFIFISVIRVLIQKNDADENIEKLESKVKSIQNENIILKDLIKVSRNETQKEEALRNNLNMRKDGEHVVVINDGKVETEIKDFDIKIIKKDTRKNSQIWYDFFFKKEIKN